MVSLYLYLMKYIIIIENEDKQELHADDADEVLNREKSKLFEEDPFYKEAERKIAEFIGQKRQRMQEDLLQELKIRIKIRMQKIDEECQMEQSKLLNKIKDEMQKEELLRELKKKLKDEKNEK